MKSLSVIIAALNEQRFLGETLRRLRDAVQALKGPTGEAASSPAGDASSSAARKVRMGLVISGAVDR
jgi:hypothetical protein